MDDDAEVEQTPSSAEAHAAAARADTSDLVAAVQDDDADAAAEAQEDGSSPEPASAAADEGDGTSPAADDTTADAGADDEWTEDERRLRSQYKSERELVRALRETKAHSLSQHNKLKELEGKLAGGRSDEDATDGATRDLPAERREGTPSDAAEDALPNTPEVLQARRFLAAAADEYDAKLESIKKTDKELGDLNTNLTKLQGRIEDAEESLKDPDIDDYGKERLRTKLSDLKARERDTRADITRLRLEKQEAKIEASTLHRDYHAQKNELNVLARQTRAAKEAQTRERQEFERAKATEKEKVSAALDRVIAKHKVPDKARARLKSYMLRDADAHPGKIADLDAFFDKRAKYHLETVEAFRAPADANYADAKRRDAAQPGPRGPAAVARARTEQPLSSKDAHRAALKGSKNIPLT